MERDNEGFEIDLDPKVVETTMFSKVRKVRREGKNFQTTDYLKNMENASQSGGISRY